jgi:hypothetical protein
VRHNSIHVHADEVPDLQLLDRRDRPGVMELGVDACVLQPIVILDGYVLLAPAVMAIVIDEPYRGPTAGGTGAARIVTLLPAPRFQSARSPTAFPCERRS